MNRRQLLILAAVAAGSLATTAVVVRSGTPTVSADRRGEHVFPDLGDKAAGITGIVVRQGADILTIERRNADFVAADSGYSIRTDMVRDLLAGTTDLTFEEGRTSDPTRYSDLGLAD